MRFDTYRILGWLVPMICMALAAVVIFKKHGEFVAATERVDAATIDLEKARESKAEVDKSPTERRFAAADQTLSEETLFLNELRDRARIAGVTVVRWTSRASTYGAGATPADPTAVDLVKGITKIGCDITLNGSYGSLRQFISGLNESDRLFTLSNITWGRDRVGTQLTLTLGRYVAPPTQKAPTSLPAPAGATALR